MFPLQSYDEPQPEFEFAPYVCQVLVTHGAGVEVNGTGFLIGKDLVLTNFHVVEKFEVQGLQCRFDIKKGKPGAASNGPEVRVAAIVADSPYSAAEKSGSYGDQAVAQPTLLELDYALLKLERPFGMEYFEIRRGNPVQRGWLNLPQQQPLVTAGSKVFILQHPKGEPLKSHEGPLAKIQPEGGTRLRYLVNTEGGSSGSPCFQWGLNSQDGLIPVCMHNYGDPESQGKNSEFNHGIPLHLIYQDLAAKGISGITEKPLYRTAGSHAKYSFSDLPRVYYDETSLQYETFISKLDYPAEIAPTIFQLSLQQREYTQAEVDALLLKGELEETNKELTESRSRHESSVANLQSQLKDYEAEKDDLERELRSINFESEPVSPDEPPELESGDPQFEFQQLARRRWREELDKYEKEVGEYRKKLEKIPDIKSSIRTVEHRSRQMQISIESKESDWLEVRNDWDDRIDKARDRDISATLIGILDTTENLLSSGSFYCQGLMTLLSIQPISRQLMPQIQDSSLRWQIRKEIESHFNQMARLIEENKVAFSEDVLFPIAFVEKVVKANGLTLQNLESLLAIDNLDEYQSIDASLSTLLARPPYVRSDYKHLQSAVEIRAKHAELLTAAVETEQYLLSIEKARSEISLESHELANQIYDQGTQLTAGLEQSWSSLQAPLLRLYGMWAGLKLVAKSGSTTPELSTFSAALIEHANDFFGISVVALLENAVESKASWKTSAVELARNPVTKTIFGLRSLDNQEQADRSLMLTLSADIDDVLKQIERTANKYRGEISHSVWLSAIPGLGVWFIYKLTKLAEQSMILKQGHDPIYDQLFVYAQRMLLAVSTFLSVVYGVALWHIAKAYQLSVSVGAGIFTEYPMAGIMAVIVCGLSVLAAVVAGIYWARLQLVYFKSAKNSFIDT